MTLNEFIKTREGGTIDYDGYYGYQCTDLVRQYCYEMFGETYAPIGNAADLFSQDWGDEYIKYENTPEFIPNSGDICIFDGPTNFGHIGVVVSSDIDNMMILDQNTGNGIGDGIGDNKIRLHYYNYSNVIGFVRNITYNDGNMNRYTEILEQDINDGYSPVFNDLEGESTLTEAEIKTLIEIGFSRLEKKWKKDLQEFIK